jgi:hypothetical protein
MASPKLSETRTIEWRYFHFGVFYKDLQKERQQFSASRHEVVPYLLSSSLGNHAIFFQSLISSQSSRSNDVQNEEEDEPSSIYGRPLQQWFDHACGFSVQQDFLPLTHIHEFHFMIDYMFIYAHDYFVLNLSLLYSMIKPKGRYLDEMMNMWLH